AVRWRRTKRIGWRPAGAVGWRRHAAIAGPGTDQIGKIDLLRHCEEAAGSTVNADVHLRGVAGESHDLCGVSERVSGGGVTAGVDRVGQVIKLRRQPGSVVTASRTWACAIPAASDGERHGGEEQRCGSHTMSIRFS